MLYNFTVLINKESIMKKIEGNWAVYNDGSQRFKDTVLEYIKHFHPHIMILSSLRFYGERGGSVLTPAYMDDTVDLFKKYSIKVYTINQFVNLINMEYKLTKEAILAMAKESKEVEKSLKKAFPDVFEEDKSVYVPMVDLCNFLTTRCAGEFERKAFTLGSKYNWELKTDSLGVLCLIPTKK